MAKGAMGIWSAKFEGTYRSIQPIEIGSPNGAKRKCSSYTTHSIPIDESLRHRQPRQLP
jgi:hypothetical protein